VGVILGLVLVVVGLYLRHERTATRARLVEQDARIAEVVGDLASLRGTLVHVGAAERGAKLPPPPIPAGATPWLRAGPLPSVERHVVTVTRDDDPVHTRATVAEAPAGEPETPDRIRARLEAHEEARDQARARGEIGALPRLGADRPSDGETQVWSAAGVATHLARAVVPSVGADDWEGTDVLTLVRSREPGAAQIPGGPVVLKGSTQRPPPVPRAPLPPLAAMLSRARAPEDERATIEMPAPSTTSGPAAVDLSRTMMSAGGPTPTQRTAARRRHGQLVAERHQVGEPLAHCNRAGCVPPQSDRPSEVDALLPEEHCVCSCTGCVAMRGLLKRAFGQVADAAVT